MSLPPLNPEKTAAGIVVDPRTLERVVPSTRRKDGTVRKEQKIRPGFTPQEDVGVFRSSRQGVQNQSKSSVVVPGSNNRPSLKSQQAKADNPFAEEPKEKTKAQLKNEKRREKRREKVSLSWDDDEDDDGGEDMKEAFEQVDKQRADADKESKGSAAEVDFPPLSSGGVGAPANSILDDVKSKDDEPVPSVTEAITAPPPGPGSAAEPRTDTSSSSQIPAISTNGAAPSIIADRAAELKQNGNGNSSRSGSGSGSGGTKQPHPIQGGRKGPLGLAHPPPIEPSPPTPSRSSAPAPPSRADTDSWRPAQKEQFEKTQQQQKRQQRNTRPGPPGAGGGAGAAQNKSKSTTKPAPPPASAPAPRERKEVRVREGGANDIGSLASRVRNLVIANTAGNAREKRSTTPSQTQKADE